jgi:hypothetical protein
VWAVYLRDMSTRPNPRPFLPPRTPPREALIRAATAIVRGRVVPGGPDHAFRSLYDGDESAELILKAATVPALTSLAGWANTLATTAVADYVASLGPASAASELISRSLQLSFDGAASLMVPGLTASASGASFVLEGAPIPVRQEVVAGPTLTPAKLGSISVFTNELARSSAIEAMVRTSMAESAALVLDSAMLGTAAAVAGQVPAGLRNGVSALTAASGTDIDAVVQDVGAVVGAVAPVGGSQVAVVASPAQWVRIVSAWGPSPSTAFPFPVLASTALADGIILAVATNALVVATDPVPEITVSEDATLHMDTVPSAIGIAGSPNTVAATTIGVFQQDSLALKVRFAVSWGLRTTGAVAWLETAW